MTAQRPPAPAVSADVYTTELMEGMGGRGSNELFVESGGSVIRPRLARALQLGALVPGLRVLDIGCGRGEILVKCMQGGARLAVGVDYATAPLELARANAIRLGLAASLGRTDAKALPFADNSFDRVFMLDIVEHLHEWELQAVWREVRRVLQPGGYLVVHTLPNRWAADYGYRLARLLVRSLPAQPPDMRDVFHVNEQSPRSLSRSLRAGGFVTRVWLQDLILSQAEWAHEHGLAGEETAMKMYSLIRRPVWRAAYRLATRSPMRLLVATDLFAVAWKDAAVPAVVRGLPAAFSEKLVALFAD